MGVPHVLNRRDFDPRRDCLMTWEFVAQLSCLLGVATYCVNNVLQELLEIELRLAEAAAEDEDE